MMFKRGKIVVLFYLFLLITTPLIGQENNQSINQDSSITKLLKLRTEYNKKVFESSFYSIQIYYGDLKEADSIKNTPNFAYQILILVKISSVILAVVNVSVKERTSDSFFPLSMHLFT